MSFQLAIADQAHEDISRNASWWAEHHSYEQAIRWKDAVYAQLETLRTFPERHPLAPENSAFPFDIREKPVGLGSRPSYRAVFVIQENTVLVLTVQRGAQDALRPDDIGVDPE
jgi:plasmid stabilization system protein ParE